MYGRGSQISFLFSAASGVQSEFLSHTMWYIGEEVAPLRRLICHRAKGEVLLRATTSMHAPKINFNVI